MQNEVSEARPFEVETARLDNDEMFDDVDCAGALCLR